MKRYDYLIAGAGMAAASAIKGIRELDREGSIAVVGGETDPPYDRPPLSKSLWKGKPLDAIWMEVADAELLLGHSASEIRPAARELVLDDGSTIQYGKLLVATGGRVRRLPFPRLGDESEGQTADEVMYLRSLADYRRLRARCEEARRFLVVGGGFIASEIAAALAMNGKDVAMVFPEEGIGARILPRELSLFLNDRYRAKGRRAPSGRGPRFARHTRRRKRGALPLGRGARGRRRRGGPGYLPQRRACRRGRPRDRQRYRRRAQSPHERPEHLRGGGRRLVLLRRPGPEDQARARGQRPRDGPRRRRNMAAAAGRNMAGAAENYGRIPYFYSDLFELGYEAVGVPDPSFETVVDWRQPFEKGTVYYVENGRVRGLVLWNVRKRVEAARSLVAQSGPLKAEDLLGRI